MTKQDYNSTKPRKRRVSATGLNDTLTGSSSGNSDVPLPDGLLLKMGGNDWNERNMAITELESFITSHPTELGSNMVKVQYVLIHVNPTLYMLYNMNYPLWASHTCTIVHTCSCTVLANYLCTCTCMTVHNCMYMIDITVTCIVTLYTHIEVPVLYVPCQSACLVTSTFNYCRYLTSSING